MKIEKYEWAVIAAIIAAIIVGKCVYAGAMYGDWTCAFSRCVKVK